MGKIAAAHLQQVLDAYANRDVQAAINVWNSDDNIDAHYNSLFRELLTYMIEDPRTISSCAHLLFIAKNLERVGDHGTNIAEYIHFLVTGEEISADFVVTATGLVVKLFGGIELDVDSEKVIPADRLIYKGMMLSGVPNLFLSFGYTNASWTLRSDVTARAAAGILNHMRRRGFAVCTPREPAGIERQPVISFSSGYVQRALPFLPQQGARQPWVVPQNYIRDRLAMRLSRVDADLEFSRSGAAVRVESAPAAGTPGPPPPRN